MALYTEKLYNSNLYSKETKTSVTKDLILYGEKLYSQGVYGEYSPLYISIETNTEIRTINNKLFSLSSNILTNVNITLLREHLIKLLSSSYTESQISILNNKIISIQNSIETLNSIKTINNKLLSAESNVINNIDIKVFRQNLIYLLTEIDTNTNIEVLNNKLLSLKNNIETETNLLDIFSTIIVWDEDKENINWSDLDKEQINWLEKTFEDINWDNIDTESLSWSSLDTILANFNTHYWKWVEKTYSQFSRGEHIVTKAYDTAKDYLGLTDDYDFCWGPENEGDNLPDKVYEYDDKDKELSYYPEYLDRLWGAYAQTAGEIYLVKANEDLTEWVRNEQLIYAPSGSKKPSIIFNTKGHYEIAVQLTPAGSDTAEIWLMSYPYADENIRKICDGKDPQLFFNHDQDLVLFYTDNEQYHIYYRLYSEDWGTEHEITSVYESGEKLYLRYAYKIFLPFSDNVDKALDYNGKNILFYKRDDNYDPLKYIMTDTIKEYAPKEYLDGFTENISIETSLSGISWLNVIAANINKEESIQLNASLNNINWLEIVVINSSANENIKFNTDLDNINWQEIIELNHDASDPSNVFAEDCSFSASLDTILWVES